MTQDDDQFKKELRKTFLIEAMDLLEDIETDLIKLEKNPTDSYVISHLFRAAHCIKGSSATVDFVNISSFSHKFESLMDIFRSDPRLIDCNAISLLLKCCDGMQKWIFLSEDKEVEKPEEIESLEISLSELFKQLSNRNPKDFEVFDTKKDSFDGANSDSQIESGEKEQNRKSNSFIKIDCEKISMVNDSIGELVVIKSQLKEIVSKNYESNSKISHLVELLDDSIRDLHDKALGMQLTSLKQCFRKLERSLRDISIKLGKKIDLKFIGEDTEIDRNIIEKITDPIMHLTRNAVDHGVESHSERIKNNKSEVGKITVHAFKFGSNICIEISDDGGGIDLEKIEKKAISRKFIQENHNLSSSELEMLIFKPAFSTSDKVSDISGRGVGLDVVKSNLEEVHGKVELSSKLRKGTTFKLTLPISNSITEGILVSSGKEQYILPMENVSEIINLNQANCTRLIDGSECFELRESYLPLFSLSKKLHSSSNKKENLIIVVESRSKKSGILVDSVVDQNQVVLKSLDKSINKSTGIAGAAIMSDGKVALVIDVHSLIAA